MFLLLLFRVKLGFEENKEKEMLWRICVCCPCPSASHEIVDGFNWQSTITVVDGHLQWPGQCLTVVQAQSWTESCFCLERCSSSGMSLVWGNSVTIYLPAWIRDAQHPVVKLVHQSQGTVLKFIAFQNGVKPWACLEILYILGAFMLKSKTSASKIVL